MFTVLFASIGSFIEEISSSIIKWKTDHKEESVFTAGFINMLFGLAAFLVLVVIRGSFVFQLASLPTFIPRAILEIFQMQMSSFALMQADRSTFAFVRNLTIPLLLFADFLLGFRVTGSQWLGIGVIIAVLVVIMAFHVIRFRGIGYSLFTAINAVFTLSLFKYNTTHFNSVEGEQIVIYIILVIYFFLVSRWLVRENPFAYLKHPIFFGQGFFHGLAALLESFAVAFGNPGIAIAAKRASAVLASIISGHNVFGEGKFGLKILIGFGLIVGLALLT